MDRRHQMLREKTQSGVLDRRITRRRFAAICPIVAMPAIWPALKCFGVIIERALDHLRGIDVEIGDSAPVGMMSLVTLAILRSERSLGNAAATMSLQKIVDAAQPDGGIYTQGRANECYETSLAIQCLHEANDDEQYSAAIKNATHFVKRMQWTEINGKRRDDPAYGGLGCGHRRLPDLSSTAATLDAFHSCGVASSDPAIQRTIVFVSRCQNLQHADGGFRVTSDNAAASCGATTYSGLRSLLSAGVRSNDARIQATVAWIQKHFDVQANPGQGDGGLFHYYYAAAKTLSMLGSPTLTDACGKKRSWRDELADAIVSRQQKNGSWVNTNGLWQENNPTLATALAILALSYCRRSSDRVA